MSESGSEKEIEEQTAGVQHEVQDLHNEPDQVQGISKFQDKSHKDTIPFACHGCSERARYPTEKMRSLLCEEAKR